MSAHLIGITGRNGKGLIRQWKQTAGEQHTTFKIKQKKTCGHTPKDRQRLVGQLKMTKVLE